jgi:eukaryotic-like serine/threonine-protein kinase
VSLKKLGRYELIRVLGRGAMGVVYEGRDPNLDRRVAIKTVKVENLSEEAASEYEARFRTEARSAARLQHPNIVSVYDSDRDLDIAYLVMEYIQGDDLKHHLDKGMRYSLEQSLKMIRDLLSALDYAHKQGIVHRDVKPANLLIEPGGRVKLTDFGVARIQDSGETTRTQGSMVGTLKYMSPEQVQGQKIDSRADLFSVGVVLYQLLTDKRPFDGDNDFSIIHQIIGHTPAPPSSFNARLPSAIDAVVARALAKDRDQRFATARDFASALQSATRRAEDQTVIPPADPFKKPDPAGTGSKAPQSLAGVGSVPSGSTVTQEVELVYLKDIKESTDPEELEGFLYKFPAGIYADLARRRLRKLSGGNSSPDQTMLSGPTLRGEGQDLEVTQVRTGTTPLPVAESVAAGPALIAEQPGESGDVELAPAMASAGKGAASSARDPALEAAVRAAEEAAIHSAMPPSQAVPPSDEGSEDVTLQVRETRLTSFEPEPDRTIVSPLDAVPDAAPAKRQMVERATVEKRSPVAALAGLATVAVVGLLAAFWFMGRATPEKMAGPVSAASSATPEAPDTLPVVLTAAVEAPPAVAASSAEPAAPAARPAAPASAASVKAIAARRAASATKPKPVASAPPVEIVRPVAPPTPAPPAREHVRVAAPVAVVHPPPSPVEVCRDKFFVAKEFCLAEHCDKPGARNHPLCVTRREEAKLREDARIRN